jgi:hypothetical protein
MHKEPMPCHATPNDITMPTLVFLPLWSPSPCQINSPHSSEHHHTRVDPSKHLHTSRPHHATHIVTTMHPHALALFPPSHHVTYSPLDPRHLLDMTLCQGEQVDDHNDHAIAHDHQPVATHVPLRAHCIPSRPTAPPHSSHLRTPPRHDR